MILKNDHENKSDSAVDGADNCCIHNTEWMSVGTNRLFVIFFIILALDIFVIVDDIQLYYIFTMTHYFFV